MVRLAVRLDDCRGGIGLGLDPGNVVTELKPDKPAARSKRFMLGDKVMSVDGEPLDGRELQFIMRPAESHDFEIERGTGSMRDASDLVREVRVAKANGVLGFRMGVVVDGKSRVVRVTEMVPGTAASAMGTISHNDAVLAVNGVPIHDPPSLEAAARSVAPLPDGSMIAVRLEARILVGCWMIKVPRKARQRADSASGGSRRRSLSTASSRGRSGSGVARKQSVEDGGRGRERSASGSSRRISVFRSRRASNEAATDSAAPFADLGGGAGTDGGAAPTPRTSTKAFKQARRYWYVLLPTERRLAWYDSSDYCARKEKGSLWLDERVQRVTTQVAGEVVVLTIETAAKVHQLVPEGAALQMSDLAAAEMLQQLLLHVCRGSGRRSGGGAARRPSADGDSWLEATLNTARGQTFEEAMRDGQAPHGSGETGRSGKPPPIPLSPGGYVYDDGAEASAPSFVRKRSMSQSEVAFDSFFDEAMGADKPAAPPPKASSAPLPQRGGGGGGAGGDDDDDDDDGYDVMTYATPRAPGQQAAPPKNHGDDSSNDDDDGAAAAAARYDGVRGRVGSVNGTGGRQRSETSSSLVGSYLAERLRSGSTASVAALGRVSRRMSFGGGGDASGGGGDGAGRPSSRRHSRADAAAAGGSGGGGGGGGGGSSARGRRTESIVRMVQATQARLSRRSSGQRDDSSSSDDDEADEVGRIRNTDGSATWKGTPPPGAPLPPPEALSPSSSVSEGGSARSRKQSVARSTVHRYSRGDPSGRDESLSERSRDRALSRPRAPSVAAQAMEGSGSRHLVSITL